MSGRLQKQNRDLQRQLAEVAPLIEGIKSGDFQLMQRTMEVVKTSGPIPDPETLKRYDEICPGFAKAFTDSFLAESIHRRTLETKDQECAHEIFRRASRLPHKGLTCGIASIVMLLGFALFCILHGYPYVAGVAVGAIAAVVGAVMYSNRAPVAGEPPQDDQPPVLSE